MGPFYKPSLVILLTIYLALPARAGKPICAGALRARAFGRDPSPRKALWRAAYVCRINVWEQATVLRLVDRRRDNSEILPEDPAEM